MVVALQLTMLRDLRPLPLDATSLAAHVKLGVAAAREGAATTPTLGLGAPSFGGAVALGAGSDLAHAAVLAVGILAPAGFAPLGGGVPLHG